MKKSNLLFVLAGLASLVVCGCNSGTSSTNNSTGNTYGPYTTSGDPTVEIAADTTSGGDVAISGTTITITGNASLGLGLSFTSVSPQAYFTLSPASVSGITVTPSGSNCGSSSSSAPSCTYTFSCTGNASGNFYYQLNGSAGAANINSTPISIICSGF